MAGTLYSSTPTTRPGRLMDPKAWRLSQLESRVIQAGGTLKIQPNNKDTSDGDNNRNNSIIMLVLIMKKKGEKAEEEGRREEEEKKQIK